MIITDSSTCLGYFEKNKIRHIVILLIEEDKMVICGYTFVEILKNIKTKGKILRKF